MNPSGAPTEPTKRPAVERGVTFDALNTGVLAPTGSLEADVNSTRAIIDAEEKQVRGQLAAQDAARNRRRFIKFILLTLVLLIGAGLILTHRNNANKTGETGDKDASQRYANTTVPIASLGGSTGLSVQNGQTLSINGQLNVNNSLVIAPAAKPSKAVAGQLYYDQTTNKLSYYDGTSFQNVAADSDLPVITPATPTSIAGASGAIGLGSGLSVAGNTLSNSGVLTLQGQAGNVTLTNGGGLVINGTTLSNSGVLSLGGQNGAITLGSGLGLTGNQLKNTGIISATGAGTITVTNDGNGNITIDGPGGGGGGGTVASLGGTIGKIAKFTGVQTIADSLLSESGTIVTVGGDLSVTGNVNLTNALSVTNGGTGSTTAAGARTNLGAAKSGANSDITALSGLTTALTVAQGGTGVGTLATNGVLLGNGTSGLSSVVAGASGLCLVSSAGAPSFQTCPGSGGVASVDGLTGALTIANTTGSGTNITINDAGSSSKGIASFNATNFLVTAGAVNTVQDIAVTSTPTFSNLNLTNPLSVSNGGTGRNTLTSNGVLVGNGTSAVSSTTGSNGQCLVISSGAPTFTTCPGSGGVSSINSQTGAVTIQGTAGSSVSTSAGVITINDASSVVKGLASFNSTNFSVSSGAVNTIQDIATTSAPSFGQLSIVSNQATNKMLTINNTNAAATGNLIDLQLNGTSKLSVAPSGNLTTAGNINATGTITSGLINGQTISSTGNFTGSLSVAGNLAVNTIANTGALTVGVGSQSYTLQGNVSSTLKATNGTSTTTVGFQSPTANVTYNFAAASAGTYSICTTAGNCVGVGGSVSTAGGTTNKLAKFTGSNAIGDSIISDNGSTVTIGGTLSVNTIIPTSSLSVGAASQDLTLQGAAVTLSSTSGGITNNLVFATPTTSNKVITLPNASGTVAVSASGPLVLDSLGNLSCPTCLSGGGGGGGVSSVNGLTGALLLQGSDAASFSNSGTTITVSDASSTVKGLAKFNATNLTVTSGSVNTIQNIAVTSTPTFAGLNLTTALTVGNGGTGATTAAGARTNLGAAASGANSDIISLSGLTTALSVAQGGTGIATAPTNGQILIGNGSGFSLNTLTAGSGVNISNTAGSITISAPGSGTCASCANASLNNLASVAINTSLIPGTAGAADLGSASLPFGQLFLSGTSASPASNNFRITGAATGARTINLPDASGTVAVSASGYLSLSASGNLTFVGPLAVTDGGTGANNASGARTNLGAAASGANSDITALSGLTTALSVAQGGTGLATLTANQLLYASSASTVGQLSNGSTGQCLVSNGAGSAPTFQTCTGAGGVSSVDGLSGALTISNTTGSGATITINDAAADGTTKGIATFNSTNFTAISGVVNTIQGIATTSSPTFNGLTLSGTLTANTITPTGSLVVGATTQAFTLQGSAASTITANGSGFTTTVGFSGTPTGNVTYNFDRTAGAGSYTICTTAGNCTGGSGGVGGSGTTGTIPKFTAGGTIGNSLLSESGSTVTANGNVNLTTGNQYQINGTQISSTALSNDSNLAKLSGTQTFSGSNNTFKNGSDSVTAFTIQNAAGRNLLNVDTTNSKFTFGNITSSVGQGVAGAIILADGTADNFGVTIHSSTLTANRTISLPDESGTICLQNSTNCGFLTGAAANGNYIQLQGTTPGTAQSGNFNITGTGIAGILQGTTVYGDTFDRASSGTLTFGNTNATTINIGTNNSAHTIAIGTGTGGQTVTIGSTVGASTTTIQGGDGGIIFSQGTSTTGGYAFKANGGQTILTMDYYGRTTFKALGSSIGTTFQVQDYLGNGLLSVSSNDNMTYIQGGGLYVQNASAVIDRGLTFSPNNPVSYTTPLGTSLNTKINIVNYDPGAFNQIIALGLPGTANATARAITIADARSVSHQPTIGILSPDENQIGGFSWDGSNSNFQVKSSSSSLTLQNSNGVGLSLTTSGSDQAVNLGNQGARNGILQFFNGTNSNTASIQAPSVSTSYITSLPTAIGSTGQCLSVASVAGSTQTLGYSSCLTSSSGVQLQGTTPGTAQTGHINITGTGIFGTGISTGTVAASGDVTITNTSSTAFKIQNASSTILFNANTSTSTITLGSSASGNYVTFTAAGGLQSFGTARPTKYISLSAEYAGAVLYGGDTGGANCSTNQNGTMTSGYDTSSSQMSYYNWTSSQASNQCYDVIARVSLPAGFDGWAAAPSIQVKTDDASNTAYAIGIIKSDGSTYDTSYGSAYTSPGTLSTSWGNMSTSSLDSSGYTPGGYMTIRIRMTAKNSANLQLGDIKLAYYSKY